MANLILILILLTVPTTHGENILFYWGCSGYSHRIGVWPLIERLIDRGHNVTFLSPYTPKVPNPNSKVVEIIPEGLLLELGLSTLDFISMRLNQGPQAIDNLWDIYWEAGVKGCESVFRNPKVLQWIESSTFDLVIINALYNDCGLALAYKFKAPHIVYSPTSHFPWWSETFGYPHENFPNFQFHHEIKTQTFAQSLKTVISTLYWEFKRQWDILPKEEAMIREALKMPEMPSLYELEQNTSLIFVNNHFTEEFPRSLPPMFVQVGGSHCIDQTKPLPEDLEDFINSSGDDGFIYLSFGTYASFSLLPQYIQNIFVNVMKNSKMNFVVKYDGDDGKGFPKNVKLVKWVSQQDVLAHPKIRAFIAHGGLLGTQESIYHGVPMIVLPLFAEQDYNAMIIHARETGIPLELAELTETKLKDTIKEILLNEKYRENTKKLSRLYKDRPSKPVDTAVWWVEYVLRNRNDTSHIRPIGINKTWYQRRQLDIWAFIAFVILIIFTLTATISYFLIKAIITRSKSSQTKDLLKYDANTKNGKKTQ